MQDKLLIKREKALGLYIMNRKSTTFTGNMNLQFQACKGVWDASPWERGNGMLQFQIAEACFLVLHLLDHVGYYTPIVNYSV